MSYVRSFILRRRFRRRIEEALAAGVLIPGALEEGGGMGRGRRRDFGEKPKLWEVWVDEHGQVHNGSHGVGSEADNLGKGEGKWEEIQVGLRIEKLDSCSMTRFFPTHSLSQRPFCLLTQQNPAWLLETGASARRLHPPNVSAPIKYLFLAYWVDVHSEHLPHRLHKMQPRFGTKRQQNSIRRRALPRIARKKMRKCRCRC